jgi:hypothetical protein
MDIDDDEEDMVIDQRYAIGVSLIQVKFSKISYIRTLFKVKYIYIGLCFI